MSRPRDPRGRFTSQEPESSSRATSSIPGGFSSDPGEDPTDTPLPESDSGQDGNETERDEPRQRESAMDSDVPAAKEAKPIKLVQFDIPNLTKQNVRTWKEEVEEFCETQGVWRVVEETLKRQNKPEKLRKLLENPVWAAQDATARYYIKRNIEQEDKTSVRGIKNSGAVWKYLLGKYERKTLYDTIVASRKVTQWKKDPKKEIEASLQHLEQLNAELYEISDRKNGFDEMTLLTFFLDGLPDKYHSIRDALYGNATLERGLVLSRLQQKELQLSEDQDRGAEDVDDSANRAKEKLKCFNCGKPGHFARDCKAPKKDKDKDRGRDKGRGRPKRQDKKKGRRRDEDSDSDRSSSRDSRRSYYSRRGRGRDRSHESKRSSRKDRDKARAASESDSDFENAYRVHIDDYAFRVQLHDTDRREEPNWRENPNWREKSGRQGKPAKSDESEVEEDGRYEESDSSHGPQNQKYLIDRRPPHLKSKTAPPNSRKESRAISARQQCIRNHRGGREAIKKPPQRITGCKDCRTQDATNSARLEILGRLIKDLQLDR